MSYWTASSPLQGPFMARPALSIALALAMVIVAPVARAQEQPPAAEEEVVVVGQRTEEIVRAFVAEIALSARGANQLARWDRRICPGISGIKAQYARPVLDRIAQHAYEIGLDVGEPGCKANVLVLVTPTPDELTRQIVDSNRDVLGWHAQRGQVSEGRDGLRAFIDSDAPVRWWHVSNATNSDGASVGDSSTGDAQAIRVDGASRIHRPTRIDFGGAFIVVDANRIGGLPLGALADYLSMVALAQIDPDTDTSEYPTILNIFNGIVGGAPAFTTLTEWDLGYLRGLYAVQRSSDTQSQQADIVNQITRSITSQ